MPEGAGAEGRSTFLLLIDGSLIAEGFDQHIPKGYVCGPIAFSVFVEFLNLRMRARRNSKPVELHGHT
ncbi:hypothetical protein [Lentzea jiangxiensis]|uniref:Uncharacterized protein n=1 Tax=Lentzea jiangxiensis TaxID=641025 RepID=A0A1H0RXA7_9PSEU|nr:hypothetical protein [Lentzea jiangxiensis]SDP34212.1 hypothetical protein SAMN05421507_107125 [Lentzea jiangxiensis]